MSIAKSVEALESAKVGSDQTVKAQVATVIEEACKRYKVAFFRYQDEWTFVDLEDPKPEDPGSEGKWHYAGFRGDRIDKNLPEAMREDLLAVQKFIYVNKLRPESFPNGISEKLQKRVEYRLSYLVSCP